MRFLFILLLFISYLGHTQVGIGTVTPSTSSMLDITSTDKGVLIPRIDLTDLSLFSPIIGDQTFGLLVFNTNTTTGIGLHFWNGSEWQAVNEQPTNWLITGNTGTNTSTNFLGNIDNVPLVLKTNNEPRAIMGIDDGNSFFNFISNPELDGRVFSGNVTGFSYIVDLGTDGNTADAVSANNAFGLDNQVYLRSGTSISNQLRAFRNRIWAINSTTVPNIFGYVSDLQFVGSGTSRNTTNVNLFDTNLRMRAGAGVNQYKAFNHTFQSEIRLNDFYGLWFERANNFNTSQLSRYYSFYQGFLGNNANRFFLYYNGDGDDADPRSSDTNDFVVTGAGNMGLGTSEPNSKLQVNGSIAKNFDDTNSAGTTFTLDQTHYTLRIFNNISTVAVPDATLSPGRIYVLIGSNGITSKSISVGGSSIIYDDVTNTTISQINANQRFTIQSDGTNWIVIGN